MDTDCWAFQKNWTSFYVYTDTYAKPMHMVTLNAEKQVHKIWNAIFCLVVFVPFCAFDF